jgi:SAM-dependent methyltransferase
MKAPVIIVPSSTRPSADMAIAFKSLHDIDAMPAAVREIARVFEPGGRLCLAIVHPINSAGRFETVAAAAAAPILALARPPPIIVRRWSVKGQERL